MLEELLYFTDTKFPEILTVDIFQKQSLALLIKRSSDDLPNATDEVILQVIYGNLRKPPGDLNCPHQQLNAISDSIQMKAPGVWAPPNRLAKATALKLLFPNVAAPYLLPETDPTPPFLAVGYDAFKYEDIVELMRQYPGEVIRFGFFTSDIASEAKLIAKTVEKFENRTAPTTYEEKIVIQLIKTNTDCFAAFSELGPSYISSNVMQADNECKLFFPEGYDIPEESVVATKKKSRRKGKGRSANVHTADAAPPVDADDHSAVAEIETDQHEEGEEVILDAELSEDKIANEEDEDSVVEGADKATSPIDQII